MVTKAVFGVIEVSVRRDLRSLCASATCSRNLPIESGRAGRSGLYGTTTCEDEVANGDDCETVEGCEVEEGDAGEVGCAFEEDCAVVEGATVGDAAGVAAVAAGDCV